MNITVDISIGELLDKLTILELKKEIIKDENKLLEITKELEVLMVFKNIKLENIFYYNILKWANHQIWIFTDIIKDSKDLNCEFAQLSKKIFDYNQYRFRVKNMLNSKSTIREQKSYKNAPPMFSHYTLGKNTFIQKILQQAGFDKLRLMHCTHYAEWEATKAYRQKYFFDKVPMADPYTWTFNHAEHTHFVLYKGIQIIGYVHLQHWPNQRAAMRIIVIDEAFGNQKYGSYLLGLCERWLKLQGVKSLHVQSSPQAYNFYCQHGYTEMPFDDPDNHESDLQDIDVGKVL